MKKAIYTIIIFITYTIITLSIKTYTQIIITMIELIGQLHALSISSSLSRPLIVITYLECNIMVPSTTR